jgi:hypothetical protein
MVIWHEKYETSFTENCKTSATQIFSLVFDLMMITNEPLERGK